jgi:hypothetical protein
MSERFECFSVKILDYYNITVHSLVYNKSKDLERHRRDWMVLKYDMKMRTEINCLR